MFETNKQNLLKTKHSRLINSQMNATNKKNKTNATSSFTHLEYNKQKQIKKSKKSVIFCCC